MASRDAIASVTLMLQQKLAAGSGREVAVLPLNKLPSNEAGQVLNLHLYRILPNANWKNMDIPWKVPSGTLGRAPLAVDLHYLLTAMASQEQDAQMHLGEGMQVLHDNPVLDPVESAVAPFERARITMLPLSLDDMEKLWAGVSKPRLLSVAYEVSAVLIESAKQTPSPLPVLTRGLGNDAIEVQAGLYPSIDRIEIGDKPFDLG
jgi:hypothetical protein